MVFNDKDNIDINDNKDGNNDIKDDINDKEAPYL